MNKILTIPNIITILRIISIPFMVFYLFQKNEDIFKWILLFALISDILDGLIARLFRMSSEFGSKLDAIADLLMYFCAATGLFVFKMDFLRNYLIIIIIVFLLFILTRFFNFILLKKPFNSYHSYLSKAMAYFQGIFIMTLFLFGFLPYIFFPAVVIGIISNIEEIIIIFILKTDKNDIKGIYWILNK